CTACDPRTRRVVVCQPITPSSWEPASPVWLLRDERQSVRQLLAGVLRPCDSDRRDTIVPVAVSVAYHIVEIGDVGGDRQ
ncbi:MAG: hypothetical protein ACRD2A_17235, partial [Vicinamibacterales bacterium]